MDFFQDFFMFCPICKEKDKPIISESLQNIVREKAKSFAQNFDLKNLINHQNFEILDVFQKFKRLEDNCKFCPKCGWSPFSHIIADSIFKRNQIDFKKEIENREGGFLLDILFNKDSNKNPRKEIKKLIQEGLL